MRCFLIVNNCLLNIIFYLFVFNDLMLNKLIVKYIIRLYVSENIIDFLYNCKK